MVAVRNSKKFEEENRPFRVDADAVIEIWNTDPLWYPSAGAYDGRVDDVDNDIEILTAISVEVFQEKYGKRLDYGGKILVTKLVA